MIDGRRYSLFARENCHVSVLEGVTNVPTVSQRRGHRYPSLAMAISTGVIPPFIPSHRRHNTPFYRYIHRLVGKYGQSQPGTDSTEHLSTRPSTMNVDGSLLNVFCFCRLVLLDRHRERVLRGGERTLVVQALTRLPLTKVAIPHTWVTGSTPPPPLPCLYIWYTDSKHAGAFTLPSTRY
jgi:hypothetical protein